MTARVNPLLESNTNSVGKDKVNRRSITALGIVPFIRLEIKQHLLCQRWLIILPVTMFISYITINDVAIKALNQELSANGWDVLFSLFSNGNHILYLFTPLCLYLISDLFSASGFEQMVLLRMGSRRMWWFGKVLTLGLSVLLYTAVNVAVAILITTFVFPWSSNWSMLMLNYPEDLSVVSAAIAIPPTAAFFQLLSLLMLGWFGLGLLVSVVTLLTNRSIIGFLTGFFVILIAIGASKFGADPVLGHILILEHLLFNFHSFGNIASTDPSIIASIVYWLLWIAIFLLIGHYLALRQNFLSVGDRA